jgi:poly(3-hydroxybutyrate) depolymerase
VDISKITTVAVIVEGTKDDITAPGRCIAALKLYRSAGRRKRAMLRMVPGTTASWAEAGAEHPPLVLDFDDHEKSSSLRASAVKA